VTPRAWLDADTEEIAAEAHDILLAAAAELLRMHPHAPPVVVWREGLRVCVGGGTMGQPEVLIAAYAAAVETWRGAERHEWEPPEDGEEWS